jgi:hypothetical protein
VLPPGPPPTPLSPGAVPVFVFPQPTATAADIPNVNNTVIARIRHLLGPCAIEYVEKAAQELAEFPDEVSTVSERTLGVGPDRSDDVVA